jgi:hypothetical protein
VSIEPDDGALDLARDHQVVLAEVRAIPAQDVRPVARPAQPAVDRELLVERYQFTSRC